MKNLPQIKSSFCLNVLLWNVKGKQLNYVVEEIVDEYNINFVVLVEPDKNSLDKSFKTKEGLFLKSLDLESLRIDIFTSIVKQDITIVEDENRLVFLELNKIGVKIGALHLLSKLRSDGHEQEVALKPFITKLSRFEDSKLNAKTILLGDFNFAPFEKMMVSEAFLNAKSSKKDIARLAVVRTEPLFYNPMWNLLGDKTGVPGTFYRPNEKSKLLWHMIDQVLLRPSLMSYLDLDSLKILSATKSHSLLSKNGIPNKKDYSDHLPVVFSIKLEL